MSPRRPGQGLEALFGPVALARTTPEAVETAVLAVRRGQLSARAEDRTPGHLSCRSIGGRGLAMGLAAAGLALVAAALLAPAATFAALVLWASGWLLVSTLLRVAAAFAAGRAEPRRPPPLPETLPTISLLVPLFRERDIAGALVARLSRLDYPADRLEICLIVEKHDAITRATLARAGPPTTMRVLVVPPGSLQTKPRALNYALDFTRGEIVGVYDAEDAPAPDQLLKVAAHFAAAAPRRRLPARSARLLQPRQELARALLHHRLRDVVSGVILPGLDHMRLAVPLGGTTLFFRREVLDRLGGWDAHNVTEDADLGVRLARHGWRTELIPHRHRGRGQLPALAVDQGSAHAGSRAMP